LAARARPCAARTRLLGFIATPNGALRAPTPPSQLRCFLFDPQKYLHSIKLGTPTSRAFFYPLDHRGYEIRSPRLSFSFSSYSSLLILLFLSLLILLFLSLLILLFLSLLILLFLYFSSYLFLSFSSYLFLYFSVRSYVLTIFILFFFVNIMSPAPPIAASLILTALY
jgi:hypothetical protein